MSDTWTAWRWFHLARDGGLTGYGVEAGRPAWRSGVNYAVCGVDAHHEPPEPYCGCGWTCSTSPAAAAAHAFLTAQARILAIELHRQGGGRKLPSSVKRGIADFVLVEIRAGGKSAPASVEDEQQWFHRAELAEVHRVFLPASLRRSRHSVAARYGVEVDVSQLDGRVWVDSFGPTPTPEEMGCGACPQPNPGAEEYPLCVLCANRARRGVMFGREDGTPFELTPTGYR